MRKGNLSGVGASKGSEDIKGPTDPVDELRKYKELLDDGIITESEFEAKKKQILGL